MDKDKIRIPGRLTFNEAREQWLFKSIDGATIQEMPKVLNPQVEFLMENCWVLNRFKKTGRIPATLTLG